MAFKTGELVVHPDHGVGRVVRIEEKRFSGAEARLYYEVSTPKSTVWVPVDNPAPFGLRPLTSRSALAQSRDIFRLSPAPLDKDRRQRQLELTRRLKESSFQTLCEIVRDLTASSWHKPLSESDSHSLRRARENLCEEWAAAAAIDVASANRELDALLAETRAAYPV